MVKQTPHQKANTKRKIVSSISQNLFWESCNFESLSTIYIFKTSSHHQIQFLNNLDISTKFHKIQGPHESLKDEVSMVFTELRVITKFTFESSKTWQFFVSLMQVCKDFSVSEGEYNYIYECISLRNNSYFHKSIVIMNTFLP